MCETRGWNPSPLLGKWHEKPALPLQIELGGRRAGGQRAGGLRRGSSAGNYVCCCCTSSAEAETEHSEITGIMRTPRLVPHGGDVGGDRAQIERMICQCCQGEENICHTLHLPSTIKAHSWLVGPGENWVALRSELRHPHSFFVAHITSSKALTLCGKFDWKGASKLKIPTGNFSVHTSNGRQH